MKLLSISQHPNNLSEPTQNQNKASKPIPNFLQLSKHIPTSPNLYQPFPIYPIRYSIEIYSNYTNHSKSIQTHAQKMG